MGPTVPRICEALAASRLLPPEEVDALRRRWAAEVQGAGAADPGPFTQWLVANEYVTEFQAALLVHGHSNHFFIGPYKLLDRLGLGRLGVVYEAVHRLGHTVALKILLPARAGDPRLLARFRREAELALRLDHPNVVRAFEAGEADGLHYLVLEYLEGETLEALLRRRGRLPQAEAVGLICQALLGLQHLHERCLVHRNLEPANLMVLAAAGPGPAVKILDISLGRSLFEDAVPGPAHPPGLTYEGVMLGSPAYMAPEQARNAHAADIRADVFSLGCILYHCLAGHPPFADVNPVRLAIRQATESPRLLRELNPAVAEGLQQIVGRMLAKDPAERYPTPEQAAQALDAFLAAGGTAPAEWPAATGPQPGVSPGGARPTSDLLPPLVWQARAVRRPSPLTDGRVCFALVVGAVGLLLVEAIGWFLAGLLAR
jgi:eukaryotic-like serine/threonine-protein kinase